VSDWESGAYAPLAPKDVFDFRDTLTLLLDFFFPEISAEFAVSASRMNRSMLPQELDGFRETVLLVKQRMQTATLFLWRGDLWKAGVQGSETFVGTRFDAGRFLPPAQLWIPDCDITIRPEMLEILGIPKEVNVLLCVLLHPMTFNDKQHMLVTHVIGPPDSVTAHMSLDDFRLYAMFPRVRFDIIQHDEILAGSTNKTVYVALNEFKQLPFITTVEHGPDRAERRRLQKHGIAFPPKIHVITLRRVAGAKTETGKHVDWNCRWIVQGHWKKQWHPSIQTHVPTYIHAYLKGPEGKPLHTPSKSLYKIAR
jgi:hypothetical protein